MKLLIRFFLAVMIISFTMNLGISQAWTKPKGGGFYKADFTSIATKKIFNNSSKAVDSDQYSNNVVGMYGEYGITDKITMVGYVPALVMNKNTTKNKSASGFGDVDLGLRVALPIGKLAVSANVMVGIPTGNNTQIDFLNTGDGEFNQIYKLAAGSGGSKWWTQAAFGLNNRSKNYSDEIRFDFEVGFKLMNERLLAVMKINGVNSRNNGTAAINPFGLYSNNVEYVGVGPELLYYLSSSKKTGISARFAGAFSGRNIQAAPQVSIGFFREMN
jgi:protein XagA